MSVNLGEIYFLNPDNQIAHPYVVYDIDSQTRIVKLCRITSNMKKISMPGIILIDQGEGNLEKDSIIETYNQIEIPSGVLANPIGILPENLVEEILNAIELIKRTYR